MDLKEVENLKKSILDIEHNLGEIEQEANEEDFKKLKHKIIEISDSMEGFLK